LRSNGHDIKLVGQDKFNCIQIQTSKKIASILPTYFVSNACNVTNKVDELRVAVQVNNANIAIITESWRNDNVPSSAVNIGNLYNVFQKDRLISNRGGVLAYVNNNIPTKQLVNLEVEDKEVLWLLHMPPRTGRPFSCIITVALFYPEFCKNATKEKELNDHITAGLDSLLKDRPVFRYCDNRRFQPFRALPALSEVWSSYSC
jgi:hypothetical protein